MVDAIFQSTRPIRGATSSIRAGDSGPGYFNPRAPYGARLNAIVGFIFNTLFQSTRPIRGATSIRDRVRTNLRNFNPRAPCGARRGRPQRVTGASPISIHAPHTGRDCLPGGRRPPPVDFNPRAPYGARRRVYAAQRQPDRISIHAPHTGRDPFGYTIEGKRYVFQSTRPIRGATGLSPLRRCLPPYFNPRAPYGARPGLHRQRSAGGNFNPRAPYGARLCFALVIRLIKGISIHAPHTGRDCLCLYCQY